MVGGNRSNGNIGSVVVVEDNRNDRKNDIKWERERRDEGKEKNWNRSDGNGELLNLRANRKNI